MKLWRSYTSDYNFSPKTTECTFKNNCIVSGDTAVDFKLCTSLSLYPRRCPSFIYSFLVSFIYNVSSVLIGSYSDTTTLICCCCRIIKWQFVFFCSSRLQNVCRWYMRPSDGCKESRARLIYHLCYRLILANEVDRYFNPRIFLLPDIRISISPLKSECRSGL